MFTDRCTNDTLQYMQSNPVSQSDDNDAAYAWLLLCQCRRANHGPHSRWAATLAAADVTVVTEKN